MHTYILSGSGDIMLLVSHVISQDHRIKASCNFMGKSPSRKVIILPNLVAIGNVVGEI